MLQPESLLGLTDEEAVELWTQAVADLDAASELFGNYNPATRQALWDARERATEALQRARRRLREGQ